jgi:hypothetical protein
MRRRKGLVRLRSTIEALVVLSISACAVHPPSPSHIDSRFYGTWANANPRYFNWWDIQADRVINYGIALDNGKCGANVATIIGDNAVDIPFGTSGTVQLTMVGEELVFQAPGVYARHKRSSPEAICRRPDGSYFENAPHPATP